MAQYWVRLFVDDNLERYAKDTKALPGKFAQCVTDRQIFTAEEALEYIADFRVSFPKWCAVAVKIPPVVFNIQPWEEIYFSPGKEK